MKIKEHTRNQKRMYRIHKQEEKIQELELLAGKLQRENDKLITQQKEFIKHMNDIIKDLETEDVADEELKGYLIQRIDTFKEILQKYKEIIGGK